jgi:hypothetical protein
MKPGLVALFTVALLASTTVVAPAHAQPSQDARVRDAEGEALEAYLEFHFAEAERKLEAAVELCGRHEQDCSSRQLAHLHLTLGFVLGAGDKNLEAARAEFDKALRIDSTIRLDPDMESRDVSRVFQDAAWYSESSIFTPPAPRQVLGANEAPVVEGPAPAPQKEAPAQPVHAAPLRNPNSLSLVAAADLAFMPATSSVCSGAQANWSCFDGSGNPYTGTPQPNMDNNNAKPGLEFSTVRLAVAYDREITSRLGLGLRLGWAFNGGPTPPGGSAFLPIHVEARATYTLPGFRVWKVPLTPFAFLSGGMAEVDTRVTVAVVEVPCSVDYSPRCARWLSAWHRAGFGFAGLGMGVRYALGDQGDLVADLRSSLTFGVPTFVATPELGYQYRF